MLVLFLSHPRLRDDGRDDGITTLGSSTWGRGRLRRVRDPTNLLPLHFLLKADNYLNMPASFLPSRAFTSVIQQHVCEWKTSTALGTWDSKAGLPTPPLLVGTAAGQTRCRVQGQGDGGGDRGGAEWRMQPQKPTAGQPRSQRADDVPCRMEVRGRLNRTIARAASWIRNQKHQPQ